MKCGKRTEDIWRFHKFSNSVLEKVYFNIGSEGVINDGMLDNPIEKLSKLLQTICKSVADIVFEKAASNEKADKKEWEEKWIESIR